MNYPQVEIKRAEPRDGRNAGMGRQTGWGAMVCRLKFSFAVGCRHFSFALSSCVFHAVFFISLDRVFFNWTIILYDGNFLEFFGSFDFEPVYYSFLQQGIILRTKFL